MGSRIRTLPSQAHFFWIGFLPALVWYYNYASFYSLPTSAGKLRRCHFYFLFACAGACAQCAYSLAFIVGCSCASWRYLLLTHHHAVQTPLHMLVALPETPETADLITLLLSAGADPNVLAEECDGLRNVTPLHIASARCRY